MRRAAPLLALSLLALGSALRAQKEFEGPFKNLQVLDKSITGDQLQATMDGFTEQLGVKCTFCHILDQYERDDRDHKKIARKMILLVQFMRDNRAKYFKDGVKDEEITCWTCHRGKAEPEKFVPEEARELPVTVIPNLGEAAELYFSPDGRSLIGNAKREGDENHHVYTVSRDGKQILRINGKGDDACSHYFPDGKRIVWTSTKDHLDMPKGNYSNPNDYPQGAELYTSAPDGSDVKRLTNNASYEAEVSVSPDGKWILFTRETDGALDLWRMKPDGTGEQQITRTPDWQEGGSFYLPDSQTILYRAWKRADQAPRGMPMTIFTIKHDGTGTRQITTEPGTNWAPHPAPDGRHFAFVKLLPPRNFEVFLMDMETGKQTQLTFNDGFDGFPAFSPDGKTLAFASSRDAKPGERKLFTYTMDVSSLGVGPKR